MRINMNLNHLNFVALDFETANRKRESACSLSLVTYQNGTIQDVFSSFIDPEDYFEPFNIHIHGITPNMVKKSPTFPQILEQVQDKLENNIVVAHNAPFDISVIRKSCERYELPIPSMTYFCTRYLSSLLHTNLQKHDLETICAAFDIPLTKHHEAESDAIACGNILVKSLEQRKIATWEQLQNNYPVHLKTIAPNQPYDNIPFISSRKMA